GDEQEQAHGEQLALVQFVTLLFDRDQETEEIRLRALPALLEKTTEVVKEMPASSRASRGDLRIRHEADRIEASGDIGRPASDRGVVAEGHPQHLADHRDG